MSGPSLRVAIIGAGIGGLSLGLALRERGLGADVFELALPPRRHRRAGLAERSLQDR